MVKVHKVFGIGLNKTGTSSLKQALITLGYKHCDMRGQMTYKFFKGRVEDVLVSARGFDSFEDWPWPLMYRRIFEEYGDSARYILTRRLSAESWLESLKAHSLLTNPDNNPRKRIFGYDYPHGAEAQHRAFYECHLTEVRQFFADQNASHLLSEVCWEEGSGWSDICAFLNEPVPDTSFPHVNRRVVDPADKERMADNEKRIAAQVLRLKA